MRNFIEAVVHCAAIHHYDILYGADVGLMSVGKLRKFTRMFDYYYRIYKDEDGPFRVNAFKAPDGVWREYPSGNPVPFHHFAWFDQSQGQPGDTLAWRPHSDHLFVVSRYQKFKTLCHRPKDGMGLHCHVCILSTAIFSWISMS